MKLADIAALKQRLAAKAKEDEKKALIEKLGEEGYAKKIADEKAKKEAEKAAAAAKLKRDRVLQELVSSLEAAMRASGNGIAATLEGMAIGKTAAKNEWYVKPNEVENLTPVDSSKNQPKYHLKDVIRLADNKSSYNSGSGGHISKRVKGVPSREKLYARYLHDKFHDQCEAVGDDSIVQAAYDEVRGKIASAVKVKTAAVKTAQAELKAEENRLSAFDGLANDMKSGGDKKRPAAKDATTESSSNALTKENTENDSKKPAAKKRKVAVKKKASKAKANDEEDDEADALSSPAAARGRGSRQRKAVSYAEAEGSEDEA